MNNNIPDILYVVDPDTIDEKVFDNPDDALQYQGYIFHKGIDDYIDNNYDEYSDENSDDILLEAGYEAGYCAPILKVKLDHKTKKVKILLDDDNFDYGNDYNISYDRIIKKYKKTLREQ